MPLSFFEGEMILEIPRNDITTEFVGFVDFFIIIIPPIKFEIENYVQF